MSDLSLLAAALARVSAADQPNPHQIEPPLLAGLSYQTKHQGQTIQPIALKLHQASVDTYRAEFSRNAPADLTPADSPAAGSTTVDSALPIKIISVNSPGKPFLSDSSAIAAQSQPSPLSLRPILTQQGGSISALSPSLRPIALKLHQASLETYATALVAGASEANSSAIAQTPNRPAPNRLTSNSSTSSNPKLNSPIIQPRITQLPITLSTTAKLSPAALALGMAQAAGAAQGATEGGWAIQSGAGQAIASQPVTNKQTSRDTARTAIALDQKIEAELSREAATLSSQSQAQAISWTPRTSPTGNIIQLPPEAVARANGVATRLLQEPTVSPRPGVKQAIAVAPNAVAPDALLRDRQAPRQPNLSPLWQLPQPNPALRAGPRSGPQLYQQRLAALKQGRLYSRLPIDSFKAIWHGVRHKPSYGQWQRLLAAEARAAGRGQGNNRLSIVLGDSISLWLPMQQLPSSQLWLNQGISGDTTAGILKRLEPLRETSPSNIYVMAGVNDLKNGATDDQVARNLQQIMRRLRQQHPQAQIHVQSILPADLGLPPGRIQRLNSRIARIAQSERVAFLNIYPQFAAPNGQMIAQLTTDGIHLSPQGYALWQSILHRVIEPWAFANRGGELDRS